MRRQLLFRTTIYSFEYSHASKWISQRPRMQRKSENSSNKPKSRIPVIIYQCCAPIPSPRSIYSIAIFLAALCCLLGTTMVRMPSLSLAETASSSMSPGKEKVLWKEPMERSETQYLVVG